MALWCKKSVQDAEEDHLPISGLPESSNVAGLNQAVAGDGSGWGEFIPATATAGPVPSCDDISLAEGGSGAVESHSQALPLENVLPGASGPTQPTAQDPAAFNWYEYNEKLKTTVSDWVFGKQPGPHPATMVSLMRQYMGPILCLMSFYMYVSSHKFGKDQMQSSFTDNAQRFRMQIAYEGHEVTGLLADVEAAMKRCPAAIMDIDKNQDVNVLCFTMLARLMCSAVQLLRFRHRKYPYRLFSALKGASEAERVWKDPPCLKDEISLDLCSRFSPDDERCMDMIRSLGCLMHTDIAAMERGHTLGRKVNQTRNQLGAGLHLKTMVADWMLRKAAQLKADALSYLYFDGPVPRRKFAQFCAKLKSGEAKAQRKKKRKKRGGGGSWRAYVSCQSKGTKCTKRILKELAQSYRNLTPEQLASYREIGALATVSHRLGFKAFGQGLKQARESHGNRVAETGSSFLPLTAFAHEQSEASSAGQALGLGVLTETSLSAFNPHERLATTLKEINKVVRAAYKAANQDREHVVETVSSFQKGQSTRSGIPDPTSVLAERRTLLDKPQIPPYLEGTCRPKPSTLPWFEWTPPIDVLTQAGFLFADIHSCLSKSRW